MDRVWLCLMDSWQVALKIVKTQLDVCYKLCKSALFELVQLLVLLCEPAFLYPVCWHASCCYFIDQIVYSFSLGNSSLGKALSESVLNFVIIETVALQNHGSAHFTAAWLVISITDIFSYVNVAFVIPHGWTIFLVSFEWTCEHTW